MSTYGDGSPREPIPDLATRAREVVEEWHRKHAPSPRWRLRSVHDLEADIALALRAAYAAGRADLSGIEEQLFLLLAQYECDEPHTGVHASAYYAPRETLADLREQLASEHCGDCTREAQPCVRCHAEEWWHKAQWLAAALRRAAATTKED